MFDKVENKNLLHVIIYSIFITLAIFSLLILELRTFWTPLVLLLLYLAANFYIITKYDIDAKEYRNRYHQLHFGILLFTIFLSLLFTYWYIFLIGFNLVSLITSKDLEFKTEFKNILLNITVFVILGSFLISVYFLIGGLFIIGLITEYHESNIEDHDYKFFDVYILGILLFSLVASLVNGNFLFLLLIPLSFFKFDYYRKFKFIKTILFNKSNILYTVITYSIVLLMVLLLSIELRVVTANEKGIPHNTYEVSQVRAIHGTYVLYGYSTSLIPNTEHVYARSWAIVDNQELPFVNDLHNLYAADPVINTQRGNMMFGYEEGMYEPEDRWKGNIARVLLYMYVTYPEVRNSGKIDVSLMKEWSKLDPVDEGERNRNRIIESIGNNPSNIFIDSPWLVNFVV